MEGAVALGSGMSGVGGLELAFRLGVAGVVVVGPTLLYLGLWRFLVWLRDDELIEVLAERGVIEDPQPSAADVLAGAGGSGGPTCEHCGTTNLPGAPVCRSCLCDLD